MSPNAALRGAGRPVVEAGAGRRLATGPHRPPAASVVTFVAAAVAVALLAAPAHAAVPPELPPELAARAVRHPALDVRSELVSGAGLGTAAAGALTALGVAPTFAHLDLATGRWGSLLLAEPMVPGAGNELSWSDLGGLPAGDRALGDAARRALEGWIAEHAAALGIDPAELAPPAVTVHDGGALIQLSGRRIAGGVPVRGAAFTAVIAHGNLILFGTRNWADLDVPTLAALASPEAEAAVAVHVGALFAGVARRPHLELVPAAIGPGGSGLGQGGRRIGYRLAWVVRPELRAGLPGEWEALVDATSGEILSFADTVHYLAGGASQARQVIGGHLPRTNDGVPPGGVEDAGAPVPYADLEDDLGVVLFADGGGNLEQCLAGTVTTRLQGLLVEVEDLCGAIEESTAGSLLDLGTSPGPDCDVAPGASAGNTRAARTAYYELSRMKEIALGHLPDNAWLAEPLPVLTNINLTCGASWNGGAVRTFRANGGCVNTGEIASILDHEWGHGMDQLGPNPGVSSPGEGIADLYAALRTHGSCIGPNLRPGFQCNGYGDPCTACTGVRDLDWALRASGQPHDLAWIDANCASGGQSPCGGINHCEGAAYAEAVWDLYRRDLQGFAGSAFDFDDDTAAEIVSRLTFLGGGLVGGWFDCLAGSAGCAADTGYLNYLTADDDDGDLTNGTPHMSAIFAAFDRHGIACATPPVADSGCAGTPTPAPVVAVTPADRAVHLTWDPIAGASGYAVFRAEGPLGCEQGKLPLGETAATEWIDGGLQGGRAYWYVVIPKGPAASCFGNGSTCTAATPLTGPIACGLLFADGFESGDTTAWTASTP